MTRALLYSGRRLAETQQQLLKSDGGESGLRHRRFDDVGNLYMAAFAAHNFRAGDFKRFAY